MKRNYELLKFCNGLDAERGGYLSTEIPTGEIPRFFRIFFPERSAKRNSSI